MIVKGCFQWFKDTNLKANHNNEKTGEVFPMVVSNGSKILIWKQITTQDAQTRKYYCCFQWFKDTNLKANHNLLRQDQRWLRVVSNGSKILIWKQITTRSDNTSYLRCCFQWFKDTNLKANHNTTAIAYFSSFVVSNGSKILIWKQITTFLFYYLELQMLFPMVQRY